MKDYINHKPQPQIHWTEVARITTELLISIFGIGLIIYLLLGV